MGGKGARRKGHQWERDVAGMFRKIMPGAVIKRGLQSRGGGAEEADVVCPYFHPECKVGKLPSPRAALLQATRDATAAGLWKMPVAVIKQDRQSPIVVLHLEDFLKFVGDWWFRGGGHEG